jgi:hypothetical protein
MAGDQVDPLFVVEVAPAPPAKRTRRKRGGAVYQGVGKTLRQLEDLGVVDPIRHAALCALARSIAASIDRESGDDETRKQASGVSLAALHERLEKVLERLDPQDQAEDGVDAEWRKFTAAMQQGPQASPVQVDP